MPRTTSTINYGSKESRSLLAQPPQTSQSLALLQQALIQVRNFSYRFRPTPITLTPRFPDTFRPSNAQVS
jgi:hypothetical protein